MHTITLPRSNHILNRARMPWYCDVALSGCRRGCRTRRIMTHKAILFFIGLTLGASCLGHEGVEGRYEGRLQLDYAELLGLCQQRDREEVIEWARNLKFFNPTGRARSLRDSSRVVIEGEFIGIPEPSPAELEKLDREPVRLEFRVSKVHKGEVPDVVAVMVVSDMLAYPGKSTSRYVERLERIDAQRRVLRPVVDRREALVASFEAGEIDQEAYESDLIELFHLKKSIEAGFAVTDWTELGPSTESTFYDVGGVIREHQGYLIGFPIQWSSSEAFQLPEAGGHIYWSEQRERVAEALESPGGFRIASPFRGFDPTSEQDCEKLTELVGHQEVAPASELARNLIDQYDLVAYGEFTKFPEATQEELRSLPSTTVDIGFQIHTLYKGASVEGLELVVNSDMLQMPGEHVSRHEKRAETLREIKSRVMPIVERRAQIQRAYQAEEFSDVDSSEELHRLAAREREIFDESGLLQGRQVFSMLGNSFHDRGGVIKPFQRYLIGVNRERDWTGEYHLHELAEEPSRIYWGEEGEKVRTELEQLGHGLDDSDSTSQ